MNNEQVALEGIKQSLGTEQGEYGIDVFVSHHIEELPKAIGKSSWVQSRHLLSKL